MNRTAAFPLSVTLAGILLMGCTPKDEQAQSGLPTSGAPIVVAQSSTPQPTEALTDTSASLTPKSGEFKVSDEAEGKRLAEQHVALKQFGWGRPTSISEYQGQYVVTFETPERERVLIGNRAVIVDRKSAVVSVQKRR